jgi:hypothetical protein
MMVGRTKLPKEAFRLVVLISVGFAGFWLGAASNDVAPREAGAVAAEVQVDSVDALGSLGNAATEAALREALGESFGLALSLLWQVSDLEDLIAELDAPSEDSPPAREVLSAAIENIGEWELRKLLGAVTRMTDSHLDEIDDVHGYAARLAEIAADGVLFNEHEKDEEEAESIVLFAGELDREDPGIIAEATFEPEQQVIYAHFPIHDYEGRRVLVKWFHPDSAQIYLLESHLVNQQSDYGWVWLKPASGWEPGDYRVEIYSGDKEMQILSVGEYEIVENPVRG